MATKQSDVLNLRPGVFSKETPKAITLSLKKSRERGKLDAAKDELSIWPGDVKMRLFPKEEAPVAGQTWGVLARRRYSVRRNPEGG